MVYYLEPSQSGEILRNPNDCALLVQLYELSFHPLYKDVRPGLVQRVENIAEMVEKHTAVCYGMGYAYHIIAFGKLVRTTQNALLFDNLNGRTFLWDNKPEPKENTMGKHHNITTLDVDLIRKAAVLLDEWDKTAPISVIFDSHLEMIFVMDDMGRTLECESY